VSLYLIQANINEIHSNKSSSKQSTNSRSPIEKAWGSLSELREDYYIIELHVMLFIAYYRKPYVSRNLFQHNKLEICSQKVTGCDVSQANSGFGLIG